MKEVLIKEYNNTILSPKPFLPKKNEFYVDFINGVKFEVLGEIDTKYKVQFIDLSTNEIYLEDQITNNMWCRSNKKYFIDTHIKVIDVNTNKIVFEHFYNAKGKKVYVHISSNAIGDTIAWFPYVEEFRKKHKCELIVSTFYNSWFEKEYPEIKFIKPGTELYNLYAMYEIGWHYTDGEISSNTNKNDFRLLPLQQTSSDALGIEYKEIKPKVSFKNIGPTIEGDYICIAPHASAHAKYWNYPNGWQKVIDYFTNKGYKIVMITQEPLNDEWHDSKLGGTLYNVIDKTGDYPLEDRANDLLNAKAYIGLGSGLSWIAWTLNTPIILISGFSEPYSEFNDCERISTPKGKCTGCFNKTRLDPSDWEWCPEHKDTPKQFECTKSITPEVVIEAINRQLKKNS